MDFYAVLDQVLALLRQRGRISYRALKRQFDLDDAYLEDLKGEIINVHHCAVDQEGTMLVWTGAAPSALAATRAPGQPQAPLAATLPPLDEPFLTSRTALAGERRQVTVLFADISGFTALAETLDPEVVRNVMNACFACLVPVVEQYAGTVDKFIGDAIMAVFGAPVAQENDAERAVYTALEMLEALTAFNADQGTTLGLHCGINTGLVIAGGIGTHTHQAYSVMGDAVNLAARLEDASARGEILVGPETYRLTQAQFTYERLAPLSVKGKAEPVQVYRVLGRTEARQQGGGVGTAGLLPLVGREAEVTWLLNRWEQVKAGRGQVVVLRGEAGIGKSRLVQALTDHLTGEGHTRLEGRGSPYHQNTALYPLIDLLVRVLDVQREESPERKLEKLEHLLRQARLPLEETVPLLASVLALALPEDRYPPLALSPQRQKQKTLETILALVLALTVQHPVLLILEDLQWMDPSTLEFLTLLVEQGLTARLLILLTCRPEFHAPWGMRPHLTARTLQRFSLLQARELVMQVAGGRPLPPEVLQHVVTKTDGVPLFIEELTRMVLESGWLRETGDHYALTGSLPPPAIPTTLHDTLMARLDRLAPVKAMAQLGATLGRTFAYDLLQAVAPWDARTVQHGLEQLIDAGLLSQQGIPPQATYHFKHALIQDAAYQSLLHSTRQRYHQQIAQVLAAQFPETVATQPELLAYHYTAAGLADQAVRYWQQAGQQAIERSAPVEATGHLTQGLAVLMTLPETPERTAQELLLQLALGVALMTTKGYAAPEVEQRYARALELSQQDGAMPQRFAALWGLWMFHFVRGKMPLARMLAEQLCDLAHQAPDPAYAVEAYLARGGTLVIMGDAVPGQTDLEQSLALYDPQRHGDHAVRYGQDPRVASLGFLTWALWLRGYPERALAASREMLTCAQGLSHPFSQAFALHFAALLHVFRHEAPLAQERADAEMALAREHGFALWEATGTILHGWACAAQGGGEAATAHMRQGLMAYQALGTETGQTCFRVRLAEAYAHMGQPALGLQGVAEGLAMAQHNAEGFVEADLYRLKGELLLASSADTQTEATTCLQQALAVARRQQAKSLELRAATSLARLWQQEGKRDDAYAVLAPIYNWFTEGLNTADLQEAGALLEALGG